jgi:L-threonylcarbamoyladenylate synthase
VGPDFAESIERAATALRAGLVVGVPTDTVYGIAVDPRDRLATEKLFALKDRPGSLQLPVLLARPEQADELAEGGLPHSARNVVESFWPGALTIVVPRRHDLGWRLGGDETTIGLRCPDHLVARELCERVGPLATTSANVHGEPPLTSARELAGRFGGDLALVIDGGVLTGRSSTVVDLTGDRVECLREGAITFDAIEAVLGA